MDNRFNNKWKEHHGKLVRIIIACLVVLLAFFTFFKSCTELGDASRHDVYVPSEDKGFVKKANLLLQHLVEQGNAEHGKIKPHSITELQRRYPALRFALPYDEDDVVGARAADIRLVGIIPDSIRDEADRNFYYNSDIPALLEKQRNSLGDRMFRITLSSPTDLSIGKIEVMAGMFKVALSKDPWVGAVTGAENALFAADNHCFVSWGKSVVPVRLHPGGQLRREHQKVVEIDKATHTLMTTRHAPIDYYRLYQSYENDSTTLCVSMPGRNAPCVFIDYISPDSVSIKARDCNCQPYDSKGALPEIVMSTSSQSGSIYPLKDELKLVVTQRGGMLFELNITRRNPMLTLSSLTRTSEGFSRYNMSPSATDRFTQQIIRGLSTTLRNTVYKDTVKLSIDPLLSLEMEHELEAYARTLMRKGGFYADDQWELSFTVMDMSNGEIIAAPYFRSADRQIDYDLAIGRKNPALTRRFIGSTFKPLVALASVLTDTSLTHLNTVGRYSITSHGEGKKKGKADFFGHTTTAWSDKGSAAGFWNGCPSMSKFFCISDDVYPVALTARALHYGERVDNPFTFTNSEVLLEEKGDFKWSHSKFVTVLDSLYDIPGPKEYSMHDSLQMEYYTWDNLKLHGIDRFGLDNVSPDPTLFYYDNFTRKGATLHNELATWVLGQGTNEWNALKLAEAWSRMLTKQKVKASLVKTDPKAQVTNLSSHFDNNAWNRLLTALRAAQSMKDKSLLWPMNDRVVELNREAHIADTLLLFSKTGTPENYERIEWKTIDGGTRLLDMGLYCMALMPSSAYRSVRDGKGGSGLMCVVRITRIVKHKNVTSNGDVNGIQSTDARRFFSDNPARLRKFYTLTRSYLTPRQSREHSTQPNP